MTCLIRHLTQEDALNFSTAFAKQGWEKPVAQFERYWNQQTKLELLVFVAQVEQEVAGYALLRPQAIHGPFQDFAIAEIADFNVLEAFQHQGIGTVLLDQIEQVARQTATQISLGVGLHRGYGAAQRLYLKRNFIFDGSGVWYQDAPLAPYASCRNDDDLVLYLSKKI